MSPAYTEDHLVEQPAIELLRDALQWEYLNCYRPGKGSLLRHRLFVPSVIVTPSTLRSALHCDVLISQTNKPTERQIWERP